MRVALSTFLINIDRLVKNGFAKRERSYTDRGQVYVSATKRGSALVREHKKFHRLMMEKALQSTD
jgi:DNA-binding MarR family transcriptional regulator